MITAYIGVGSNLDDPPGQVRSAIAALEQLPDTTVTAVSSLYRSRPVGPRDQPDFTNAVVRLETALSAFTLLRHMQTIEDKHGRRRDGRHWGPRTLDLDLLLFGDQRIAEPDLRVPHPEMTRRGFVLAPLVEISPEVNIPGAGPARAVLEGLDTSDLVRLD
jgi:2-amino-4-hydroxy-6-hydroxymethyldihydropteridine diphosphokinase